MTRTDLKHNQVGEIAERCLHLFDGWCERRSVIPLVYLMHAWPILSAAPGAVIRLQSTLQDLKRFHADSLTQDDLRIIEQLLGIHAHAEKDNPDVILP